MADDRALFMQVWSQISKELRMDFDQYGLPLDSVEYFSRMLEYNVPGGKLNRGLAVVATYRLLTQGQSVSQEDLFRAAVLGWIVEILQAFFLVADDVMDNSVTRRGQPCWYRVPQVGTIAINDSLILETCMYLLLKRHFHNHAAYVELTDLIHDVTFKTEIGQLLDVSSTPPGATSVDFSKFTIQRYQQIVKFKTAFYSFYLPVALGLHLAGKATAELLQLSEDILCQMGEYFQIQDDYLDCYGDPETIGKIGTDIQDGKCSWLVVQTMLRTTPEQRSVLEASYAKHDDDAVKKVKELYRHLDLERVYHEYEEDTYQTLRRKIESVSTVPKEVYYFLLYKIYKRSK